MIRSNRRYVAGLLFFFMLSCFFVFAQNAQTGAADDDVETWNLRLMGQTEGSLEMILIRTKTDGDICSIKGKASGSLHDNIGGYGEAQFKLKGKIENGVFTASLAGQSETAEGPTTFSGKMKGSISQFQGLGTWEVSHMGGSSSGEYTMEKI